MDTEDLNDRIRRYIMQYIQEVTPVGTRVMINESHMLNVRLTCDGIVWDLGYKCCLHPGHDEQCFTAVKKVKFDREN